MSTRLSCFSLPPTAISLVHTHSPKEDIIGIPGCRSMLPLPVEICEMIYSFACTDDGTTGRSLSLVSKYVRKTSHVVSLQSIALKSFDQLERFCIMLEDLPPRLRRVRNLFITGPTSPTSPDIALNRQERLRSLRHFKEELHRQGREASLIVARVLSAIAPTVRTLALFMPLDSHIVLNQIIVRLPALEELTLPDSTVFYPPTIPQHDLFPYLKRLHLAGPYVDHLEHVFRRLSQFAPSLTHLRITGLEQSRCDPDELKVPLGIVPQPSEDDNEDVHSTPKLPPTLEQFLVQMAPAPSAFRIFNPGITPYELVQEHFEDLVSQPGRFKVVLLPPQTNVSNYDLEEAKRQWLSRVNGGDGCWMPLTASADIEL